MQRSYSRIAASKLKMPGWNTSCQGEIHGRGVFTTCCEVIYNQRLWQHRAVVLTDSQHEKEDSSCLLL